MQVLVYSKCKEGKNTSMRIVFFIAIIGLLFSSVNRSLGQESQDSKIDIFLGWTHQFQFAGYYAAVEKGFYEELGLDVTLHPGFGNDFVEDVINKKYDYAIGSGTTLISHPRNSEIGVIAAIMQQSPLTLISLRSNNINTLKDLEGRKISGGVEIMAMLKAAGVDLNSVEIGNKYSIFEQLLSGEFDAIAYYLTDEVRTVGGDSILFNTFRPIEYGINFYGECLFTSLETIENRPEQVQRIISATAKGWHYAIDNRDEMIQMILDKYPSNLTREDLSVESEIIINSLIQPRFHDIGDMQTSKWENMSNILKGLDLVDNTPDMSKFIYRPDNERILKIQILRTVGATLLMALIVFGVLTLYNRQLKAAIRTRTASLQKSNAELDKFVYSVSHDIRSPLKSILGILGLLKVDKENEKKYLEMIESSVTQLDNFANEVLDYSKNSRSEITPEKVDIKAMMQKTIDELKYLNGENKTEIVTEYQLDADIVTDPWRLKVIVSNIVSNGLKYADFQKTNPYLKINVISNVRKLRIEFKDNGLGILDQHIRNVYRMFYRGTSDTSGSGLGLYIVKEAVETLKGNVYLESTHGKGTEVVIEIPST